MYRFGRHELRQTEDVAWVVFRGPENLAEIQQFTGYLEPALAEYGYIVIVCDLTDAGALSADSRKYMATWLSKVRQETIFINASFVQRTLLTMVDRASELLHGTKRRNYFVRSQAEAEALVPVLRASLRASPAQ